MFFSSVLSDQPDTEAALECALNELTDVFFEPGRRQEPDLVVVFFSSHHRSKALYIGERIREAFGRAFVVGCSAGGIVVGTREIEAEPSMVLVAARLPGVLCAPFALEPDAIPSTDDVAGWRKAIMGDTDGQDPAAVLVFPDPFTVNASSVISGIANSLKRTTIVGGLASGAQLPGQTRLLAGMHGLDRGVVGLALSGNVVVDTIVAQGCRPIGQPMFVTRAAGNILYELDGRPAATVLQHVYKGLPVADKKVFRDALSVGVVMRPNLETYGVGDFLIRDVLGLSSRVPTALALGTQLQPNDVIQFHLRDPKAASEELVGQLQEYRRQHPEPPSGGLMFSCVGRGQHFYGRPNHDVSLWSAGVGDVPIGGFFGNGEIGPVGLGTYLHAYTTVFAMFRPSHTLS